MPRMSRAFSHSPDRLARSRARIYSLLARIWIRPADQELLRALRGTLPKLETDGRTELMPRQMLSGIDKLRRYMAMVNDPDPIWLTALSAEFTRLTMGLTLRGPPPPYESVYMEGICFGQSAAKVEHEYRRFGLTAKEGGEPPDHISFELDFMRFLCEREAEAWSEGDGEEALRLLDAEERFMREHLSKWASEFCENIRRHGKLDFYRGWADVTEGWISLDQIQIREYKESLNLHEGGSHET